MLKNPTSVNPKELVTGAAKVGATGSSRILEELRIANEFPDEGIQIAIAIDIRKSRTVRASYISQSKGVGDWRCKAGATGSSCILEEK